MLGKIEDWRRGRQRMRRLDGITDLKDFSLSKVQELDGQGSLVCRNPWDLKESDMTEWNELNWTEHGWHSVNICSVQFSSVAQSCPTLCDPMNFSTPGLPVHHQLPGLTQTHVHWVGDAIQPSHPLFKCQANAKRKSGHNMCSSPCPTLDLLLLGSLKGYLHD